jgi:chorismate mutase
MMMDISSWRKKIDRLNTTLVKLLNERARYAVEIGKIKKKKNLPVADPLREKKVLARVAKTNRGPLSQKAILAIFKMIMRESRKLEAKR